MTPEQAKIILLEDALVQSHHTISFLHNCLTMPVDKTLNVCSGYSYEYPEQTVQQLNKIEKLVKISKGCFHSRVHNNCSECMESVQKVRDLEIAKQLTECKHAWSDSLKKDKLICLICGEEIVKK